jgi:hypothetical protein
LNDSLINIENINSEFKNYLKKNNIKELNRYFSDSDNTKDTMASYFHNKSFSQIVYQCRKENNSASCIKESYMRKNRIENSPVVNTFIDNGYKIKYFHGSTYLINCTRKSIQNCSPNVFQIAVIHIKGIIDNYIFSIVPNDNVIFKSGNAAIVDAFEKTKLNANKPTFNYLHLFSPGHSPSHSWVKGCNELKQKKRYISSMKETQATVKKILDRILKNDKEAIVMIGSDHGPMIYNRCDKKNFNEDTFRSIHNAILFSNFDDSGLLRPQTTKNAFNYLFSHLSDKQLKYNNDPIYFCEYNFKNLNLSKKNKNDTHREVYKNLKKVFKIVPKNFYN